MDSVGAIIFLPREIGSDQPLLFQPLLFAPAALWLVQDLRSMGADHFLVVCHDDDRERATALFPPSTCFVTSGTQDAAQQLGEFLVQHPRVLVFTRPVLILPDGLRQLAAHQPVSFGGGTGIYELTEKARQDDDFDRGLRTHGEEYKGDGFFPLTAENLRATAQDWARLCSVQRLTQAGVRILDQNAVCVDPTVTVGAGTVLLPGTILRGETVVGKHCEIGPNAMIRDCTIGDRVTVNASQLNESTVDDDTKVGPFAYVRPHCHIGRDVKVGDFVELKNSVIGDGTKISHLTYVGDSDVGAKVNFGCGTVTVNYDGASKFRTTIGDNAFIGCNTNLVAPVRIGEGAYTAAGSTITTDVPADSLAIARSPQTIKVQWAAKRRRAKGKK